jgi:putative sigma-54 modulation protein
MTIDIRFRGLASSEALRAHIIRRIEFQLSRLGRALSDVAVRLSDVNGPKGGVDKRCHLVLHRPGHAPLTIDEVSVDAYSAADIAVERAVLAVERGRERDRAVRRRAGAARAYAGV